MAGYTNAEMTAHMVANGFCEDEQSFIRGEKHVRNTNRWMAMKADQNHVRNDDGTITVWYDGTITRSHAYINWVNHAPGTLSFEVWFKHNRGRRAWRPLGKCVFSKPWAIDHTVTCRGRQLRVTQARIVIPMHLIEDGSVAAPEP